MERKNIILFECEDSKKTTSLKNLQRAKYFYKIQLERRLQKHTNSWLKGTSVFIKNILMNCRQYKCLLRVWG